VGAVPQPPADVHLSPVPFLTPLRSSPFHITTYLGTLLVFAAGAASLLVAPWVTRAVVLADRWLIRNLLGPGRLMQRVRDLEQTRARRWTIPPRCCAGSNATYTTARRPGWPRSR